MKRLAFVTATLMLALLTSCSIDYGSLTPIDADADTRPSASPAPSATADPDASATPPPADGAHSPPRVCADLLDAAATERFADAAAEGWREFPDFADRISQQPSPLARFVELDGLLCQWGQPNTGDSYVAGYSPITPSQRDSIQAELLTEGATVTEEHGGDVYCAVYQDALPGEPTDCYLFLDGLWLATFDPSTFPSLVAQTTAR